MQEKCAIFWKIFVKQVSDGGNADFASQLQLPSLGNQILPVPTRVFFFAH
jgi:hypothetical protein